jgi:quinol monooxygenase YgiN
MPKPEDEVVVVAHFTARQGKEGELLKLLYGLLEPTRKKAGCIRYELNQEIENPSAFTVAEKFASREAFDAHVKMPYVARFGEQLAALVESKHIRLHRELLPVSQSGGSTRHA